MAILSVSNLGKSFGTDTILQNVSFLIEERDKIGLVGLNGAGKSTLLKILAGRMPYDTGTISVSKGTTIGYMAQDIRSEGFETVGDALESVFETLWEQERQLRDLEKQMSLPEVYSDEDALHRLMERYSALSEAFKSSGGYEIESRIRGVLKGLGFEDPATPLDTLSGGQKTRLALGRLLLESPQLLLLDEPTNYLDMESLQWLEGFLKDYPGAVLVVSHDRYFLDRMATRIFELENCRLTVYSGNYSEFIKKKETNLAIEQKHEILRQKEAERLKKSIQNFISHRNFVQAETRRRMLEDLLPKSTSEKAGKDLFKVRFNMRQTSGREVLTICDLEFSYGNKLILSSVNLRVFRGERIGIIGPNGIGKSTLLKILAGELEPDDGSVYFGHKVQPVFFAQEQEDLSPDSTVLSEVWSAAPGLSMTQVRSFLGSMLFSGEDVEKPIGVLSGGEKSRVALAKAILQGANLLLLDEPTNHLDIISKEKLEQALLEFDGTIIAVSHDRYFLSKIATRIWEFTSSGIRDFDGDFNYYLEKKRETEKPEEPQFVGNKTQQRKARMQEKKRREEQRQEEMRLKQIEQDIQALEREMEELEHLLCLPEVYGNPERAREVNARYRAVMAELEELYENLG
ncbi:ATP-binding cassette domain-containing protein [Biomaibacter acetigenes]|uniref:ATP-binding cassette domain-containing protein n=1 Tax=Biomaibacter acetigenes TaxID=2316383 RepID=A0A3G2R7M4_9FIRM|nr:ABC-F family ATP-binding cassette domain-containing protein [Biomaibacter acetigenes]AYO31472.1 ATP-binding cassette domain-containing protein [Biomaibacter acetigenes]